MWSATMVPNHALETALCSLPVKRRVALKTCVSFLTLHCCSVVDLSSPL